MIRLRFLLIIAASVATMLAAFSAPAALACDGSNHCYGRVNWAPSGTYTGGIAYLNASRLSVTNPNTQFVDHEMWDVTNGSYAWVEIGLTVGPINGVNHGLAIFWADADTLGNYSEHFVQGASYSTTYITKGSYNSGGKWAVYLNGSFIANSTSNHGSSLTHLAAGAELTTNDAKVTGTMTGLQKRASDNVTWSYDWPTTNFDQNSPATAGWNTQYTDAWDSAN